MEKLYSSKTHLKMLVRDAFSTSLPLIRLCPCTQLTLFANHYAKYFEVTSITRRTYPFSLS